MRERIAGIHFAGRLWVLIVIYILIAIWYANSLPPGEGVDELSHFKYVQYVAQNRRLPLQGRQEGGVRVVMAYHSPLYYIVSAILIHDLDTSDLHITLRPNPHFIWSETGRDGWNAVLPVSSTAAKHRGGLQAIQRLRSFGIVLGVITLIVSYKAVQELLPDHPWSPLGAVALMGLNPSFIYMTVNIHHDVLLAMLFTVGLYGCIYHATHDLQLSDLVIGGVVMGAVILTKLSGLALLPAMMAVLWLRPIKMQDWKNRFWQTCVFGGVTLLVCGWWFVRNQVLYGDLIGLNVYLTYYTHNLRRSPFTWSVFTGEFLAQLGRTFWGAFGFMHILLPFSWRRGMWIMTGIALLGYVVSMVRNFLKPILFGSFVLQPSVFNFASLSRNFTRWASYISKKGRAVVDNAYRLPEKSVAWLGPLVALAGLFVFFVRFAAQTLGAGHGRYLLPVAITLGSILIGGLNAYTRWRHQRLVSIVLLVGMSSYAVASAAIYAWPKYKLPDSIMDVELAEAMPLGIHYDGGVELTAVKVSSPVAAPGQWVQVRTYWSTHSSTVGHTDPYVYLTLVTDDDHTVKTANFWPEAATVPDRWGERIVAKTSAFHIPPKLSGHLCLKVRVRDGKEGPWLLARGNVPLGNGTASAIPIFKLLALGSVQEIGEFDLPAEQRSEVFANTIQLRSVQLPQHVQPGHVLPVAFYWQVLDTIDEDYTLFVHVLDQNDILVAQLDSPPGGGTMPTSSWPHSKPLLDTYPVALPDDLEPGEYEVYIGMYTWPDLIRQPITRDGVYLSDVLRVGSVIVEPPER
ncbi:MAG: glycosyltransferase family 39 protein [Anaerolineae bacterium]|nr:glycosyltransferase family 39 protein [Anaerolineae bacterium]